eukprot:1887998-Rhodomonas_salina.2
MQLSSCAQASGLRASRGALPSSSPPCDLMRWYKPSTTHWQPPPVPCHHDSSVHLRASEELAPCSALGLGRQAALQPGYAQVRRSGMALVGKGQGALA